MVVITGFAHYIPNSFTPDGDGVNDVWTPVIKGYNAGNLTIYNRWGKAVYNSDDLSKPWTGGDEWERLRPGEGSDKYLNLKRTRLDGPSHCISSAGGNTSTASITHPTEKRKFSIAELRRIGGFPDDFVLTGTFAQQWERIGRAVPPVMMMHIANTIKEEILCKIK